MTTNSFETDISNANFNSAQYYIDDDGSFKFVSPVLASSNFDGSIPIFEGEINAEDLSTGMSIKLDDDQFYGIISIFKDDPDLEDDPSTNITIEYLDSNNNAQRITYDFSDTVTVRYEDWDEKYLGTQGWALTYGGNAIFANVGVRGRIEATEGYIDGSLVIGESGTSTFNDLATTSDIEGFIDDLNETISASIQDLYIDVDTLSSSLVFLYEAGFITNDDLITTGNTTITGNNITTGVIDANLVRVTSASSLVQNRGVQLSAVGLEGYDNTGTRTFFLSTDGSLDITGYATLDDLLSSSAYFETLIDDLNETISASIQDLYIDLETFSSSLTFLYNAGFVSSAQLITTGGTRITGNNITTGVINANLVRVTSASSLVQNRGVQFSALGLEGYNNSGQRTFFLSTDGTLDITGYATDSELSTASSTLQSGLNNKISVGNAANDVNSYTTNISGGKIRTGTIQSQNYSYSSGLYSNNGMQINLDGNGYIRSPKFYLDSAGNAYFAGDVSGATGTFTGPISSTLGNERVLLQNGGLFIQYNPGSGFIGVGSLTGAFIVSNGQQVPVIELSGNLTLGQLWTDFNIIIGSGAALLPEGSSNLRLMSGKNITPGYLVCQNVYDYQVSGTVPVGVTSGGIISRLATSTQREKYDITPLWGELGPSVDVNKISDPVEEGVLDFRDVLKLAPSQFSRIELKAPPEDGEEVEDSDDNPEYKLFGFIAEDVEDKFPIATIRDEDGLPLYFDNNAILAAVLAVVAEQDETIKSMQQDLDDLKTHMLQLESQLGG